MDKTNNIQMRIIKISELGFRFNELPDILPEDIAMKVITGLESHKNNSLGIIFDITYHIENRELLNIKTQTIFEVKDSKGVIKIGDEEIDLPQPLMVNLLSIAYSTTRGVLAMRTTKTPLETHPLPLIDPVNLLPPSENKPQSDTK